MLLTPHSVHEGLGEHLKAASPTTHQDGRRQLVAVPSTHLVIRQGDGECGVHRGSGRGLSGPRPPRTPGVHGEEEFEGRLGKGTFGPVLEQRGHLVAKEHLFVLCAVKEVWLLRQGEGLRERIKGRDGDSSEANDRVRSMEEPEVGGVRGELSGGGVGGVNRRWA